MSVEVLVGLGVTCLGWAGSMLWYVASSATDLKALRSWLTSYTAHTSKKLDEHRERIEDHELRLVMHDGRLVWLETTLEKGAD